MVTVRLKVYRRHTKEDTAYSVETVRLYDKYASEKIKSWKNNPWFYEVLSVKYE